MNETLHFTTVFIKTMEYFEENILFSFEEPQMRSPFDFLLKCQQNENSKAAQQHEGEAPCSALNYQGNSSKQANICLNTIQISQTVTQKS